MPTTKVPTRSCPTRGRFGPGTLGVTMFELMIVVTMVGILTGIALTRLDWTRYRADAAGRSIMAELASAQRLALSLQANIVVTFPDSTRMMVLEDINNSGTPSAGERVHYVTLNDNFAFGRVPDTTRRADDLLWQATQAGIAAAVPGATAGDIWRASADVLDRGLAAIDGRRAASGRMGHGIGLRLTEPPSVHPDDTTVLVPGMVIAIRAVQRSLQAAV